MTRRFGTTGYRPVVKHVTLFGKVFEVEAAPFCDCVSQAGGFVQRADGVWVRPCCMRVTQHVWIKHGERPNHPGCAGCGDQAPRLHTVKGATP